MIRDYSTEYIRSLSADDAKFNSKPLEGVIEGYPIIFGQKTLIVTPDGQKYYEIIDRHSLDMADLSDIIFTSNHDGIMIPYARHRRGKRSTMDIAIDDYGMKILAKVDVENNADAKKLCSAVSRNDISDMSFIFGVKNEDIEWIDLTADIPTRIVKRISYVCEVTACTNGAYPQTEIYARSVASLDNDKKALDNAHAIALDNDKKAAEAHQAALQLEIKRFLFLEEQRQ